MRRALVAFMVMALAGCARATHDQAVLRVIAAESVELLKTPSVINIPQANWPATIKSLEPKEVFANADGLYIVMSSFYVANSGYFIPRDKKKRWPGSGHDPAYWPLGPGVYWYKDAG
jgi:hypothetical protein